MFYSGQDVVMNQFFIDNNQDNKELDDLTRKIVTERDRERLKKMTYYCFTNECLRDYILRYFGEYGPNYCGNCVNCLIQFEKVDVTEIAKEEKVPPYIVFSDKTLVHMCAVKPKTKTEMLSVSGVGEFKYVKYGERFLRFITPEYRDDEAFGEGIEELGEEERPVRLQFLLILEIL